MGDELRLLSGDLRLFDTAEIDETAICQALAIEREGYKSSHKIVVMSKRSADYLARHYNASQYKIRVLPPGANIPERLLVSLDNRPEQSPRADRRKLVVGFIGLYTERKGLPTIADGVHLLRSAGYDIRLHVIGKCPPEISQRDGVTHFGLIDKTVDIDRFIEIVRKSISVACSLAPKRPALPLWSSCDWVVWCTSYRHGCRRNSGHCGPRRWTIGFATNPRERSGRALCPHVRRAGSVG